MQETKLSRRRLVQLGLGAAAGAGLASGSVVGLVQPAFADCYTDRDDSPFAEDRNLSASVSNAYFFLNQMMDAYAHGNTTRLVQSYADQIAGGTFFSTAFTYDNALLLLAYLTRGRRDDLARAQALGNALVYAQQADPNGDGRFRQAYFAGSADSKGVFVTPGLSFFQGSAVGDVAWAGISLAQLFARTGIKTYLDAAIKAATLIETTTRDNSNVPPGGYFFGNGQSNKSTEHNIDVYALFTMLARLTGQSTWLDGAQHARAFIEAMWDAPSGHFWTGTSDPTHIFFDNSPEDVQTWSYMALLDSAFQASLEWVKTNLATTDTSFALNNGWGFKGNFRVYGSTYASLSKIGTLLGDGSVDPDAVWCEGTSHVAAALLARRLPQEKDIPTFHGDVKTAGILLENMQVPQTSLGHGQTVNGQPLEDGQGIVAATSPLNTGFGFNFFPIRHIGATSWYVMAAQAANPFQLNLRTSRS
jgi:hypothetical protein